MANASFTRDEVILALDVLYFSDEERLTPQSESIRRLSQELNRIPIHPTTNRSTSFRNTTGLFGQIKGFERSKRKCVKDPNVGLAFYRIDQEFEDRLELHNIAEAIRKNISFFETVTFGSITEADGFPEGALLGHLHRVLEARDGAEEMKDMRCAACGIDITDIYSGNDNLMQLHLCVPLTRLDGNHRYISSDFATVCPNCHAALHRIRPWKEKSNIGEILR